jgi:hypothetical protein
VLSSAHSGKLAIDSRYGRPLIGVQLAWALQTESSGSDVVKLEAKFINRRIA